jgi:L-rhamnose mutarotase
MVSCGIINSIKSAIPFQVKCRPNGGIMIHKAFLMTVNPDMHLEYERRHNPIWKDLEVVLKSHGVHNYNIFLAPETSQLFAYVEIDDQELWDTISQTKPCRRWWAYMKDIMPSNPDNSPKSIELKQVFYLP